MAKSARRHRYADQSRSLTIERSQIMLYWALVFLVFALVAAAFGFGGIASASASIAQILFIVFLVLFVASLVFGFVRRPPA